MKTWISGLLLLVNAQALADGLLAMDSLYGTMDRSVLETQIERVNSNPDLTPDQRLKRLGIAWHNLAVLDVSGASTKARSWLEKAHASYPHDMTILAYLGSARTLVARDSWNVVTKVSNVNQGINLIDRAVRNAPNDVAARLVRANNSLTLPKFFGRRSRAVEDFSFLHDHARELRLGAELEAEVCVRLGELLAKQGNSAKVQALFAEAERVAPHSKWAARAASRMTPR